MGTTYCLFACALAVSQPAPAQHPDWLLVPQLSRGQELVYRGTFAEEALGTGTQFNRSYALETRVFVLSPEPQGTDAAFCTIVKLRSAGQPERAGAGEPSSVRLELGRVDARGRIVPEPGCALRVPLDGPPTIESGMFVEAPRSRAGSGQSWDVGEEGRPTRSWQIAGKETINGTTCVKLVGVQQSADWDHPRADSQAWRRTDTVWLAPRGGYASRLERTIERREPARREPSQKSVTRYDLESSLQFPGQLWEDRQREILLGRSLSDALAPLLPQAGKVGPRPFEAILAKINYHYDHAPPTPYRAVLRQVQSRAEAGKRGESPPAVLSDSAAAVHPFLALGRPAPDFLVKELTTNESTTLRRWLGRPVLMVFYNPSAPTAEDVLAFAQSVCDAHPQQVTVLGLAVFEDSARILKQRTDLHLTFPILAGGGLRLSYALDTTPKMIVLDGAGVTRGAYVGWGPELASTVQDELLHWVHTEDPPAKPKD